MHTLWLYIWFDSILKCDKLVIKATLIMLFGKIWIIYVVNILLHNFISKCL